MVVTAGLARGFWGRNGVGKVCPDPGSSVKEGLSHVAHACDIRGSGCLVCSLLRRWETAQPTFGGLLKMRELNHRAIGNYFPGLGG